MFSVLGERQMSIVFFSVQSAAASTIPSGTIPLHIIIIISGFGIYGAAVVPDSGVGNTWQRLTLVLHEFLSNGLTPSRLHIVISFLTHADHVFLGLPRFLVPGTPNRVMELMQEVARCTCKPMCM